MVSPAILTGAPSASLRGRVRRGTWRTLVLSIALPFGFLAVGSATPAAAAPASYEYADVCFVHYPDRARYTYGVYIYFWNGSNWTYWKPTAENAWNGCVWDVPLPRGYHFKFQAWKRVGSVTFAGWSNYGYSDGYGALDFGWNWVYRYG